MGRVDQLIQQLETGNTNERLEAASALGQLGDPKALPALIRALDDNDANVHIAAARAVGKIGDLNAIQNLLDAYERRTIQFAEPIFEAIGEILDRTAPDEKNRAVFAGVVDRLIQFVQQDDSFDTIVRAAAAEALGKTRDPKAIPVLTEQLREDKPTPIATAAARALRHFNDPQVIHALAKTAANREIAIDVREVAFESIANIGNPNTVDTLISILEDPSVDYYFRSKAARALGRIGDPKAIEPLIRTLENETTWSGGTVREAIAEALGAFRDPRATDALVAALASDYLSACAAAASLKKLRDKRAVEPLIRILEGDPSQHHDYEREFAAQILGVLGDPRAIPALVNALYDDFSELVPQYASESLQLFVLAYPDAIMQLPPEDRHRLGRLIQDAQRDELLHEVCE
jgi:HEAT repeat protein